MSNPLTRRQWTLGTVALASASDLAEAWQHAHESVNAVHPPKLEYLDPAEAKEIEAITSEIIPSEDSPGAREAGVVYFIDRALATWETGKRGAYRSGMDQLQQLRKKMFPDSTGLAAMTSQQRVKLIAAIESSPFFDLLRTHTVIGFYGSPAHGGNRGGVGWAQIGFEDKMAFEPPFGYYDAPMNERKP